MLGLLMRAGYPAVALAPLACNPVCAGAGCADEWPTSRLAVHLGGDWGSRRLVLGDADGRVDGAEEHGPAWSVAAHEGRLYLGLPAANGVIVATPPVGVASLSAAATGLAFASDDEGFGSAVAVDADRVAVAAVDADNGTGSVSWFDAVPATGRLDDADVAARIVGFAPGDHVGAVLRACPDDDGDGRAEWLISAPGMSAFGVRSLEREAGAVLYVRSSEIDAAVGAIPFGDVGLALFGDVAAGRAGSATRCDVDLDGDGRADWLVGAPFVDGGDGAVYTVLAAERPTGHAALSDVGRVVPGPYAGAWFGAALAHGDIDGDGVSEVFVGAPGFDDGRGRAALYAADAWLGATRLTATTVIAADRSRPAGDHLARTIELADLDGDGLDELLVGAPDWRIGGTFDVGRLFVWRGRPEGLPAVLSAVDLGDTVVLGDQPFQRVGGHVDVADVDDDGRFDVLLGTRGP